MRGRTLTFIVALTASVILIAPPAVAHKGLKLGRYECWLSQIGYYSNYDLKIQDGGTYVFMLNDGSWKKSGNFEKDGAKINFTSGYLKKKNFKGMHDSYDSSYGHTHVIYLYKGTGYDDDDLKYDCSND